MTTSPSLDQLHPQFEKAGQEHVFRFWEDLSSEDQARLLQRASEVDLQEVALLVETHVKGGGAHEQGFDNLEPAPFIPLPEQGGDAASWQEAEAVGAEALRAGRVAAFTVAGGQGTRLGYDGPKGTFPVTPVTQKTLFQVFAEKIARSAERFGAEIHWFILTSEINNDATVAAFKENNFFGLESDRVHFIVQGLVPAVDQDGKILMADRSTIAMTPDGHGGSLRALVRSGATALMAEKGIDCISYFQVDNPLIPCLDPAFIGFHILGKSECSSKMIPKAYPLEKVGHFCLQGGKTVVIEYSDLPEEKQQETLADGSLRFVSGSVAIHVFDRAFIERVGGGSDAKLPFHRADKKIPFVNEQGEIVKPESPNGIKFEMFVFDALPLAENPVIIEGARSENFSPVKNAEGVDSPQTCKEDQLRQYTAWLKAAGKNLASDETGLPEICFEISPRFAADKQDFVAQWEKLDPKPEIKDGVVLG
ncbi:UDPGP type 1 family protein [Kiritimatiellaeota bacterium B1221]|nr:UDPGP type 1 family protein [Kiritimatiellaeota bacterium B1221]